MADGTETPSRRTISLRGLFRFATKGEIVLNAIGTVAAVATGSATPFMSLFFGNMISSFVQVGKANPSELAELATRFKQTAARDALHLVFLGLGMFAATFLSVSIWTYTGEKIANRIRQLYFESIIRQDVAFYDDVQSGEIAARIEVDAFLVQQGLSERFVYIIAYISSFFTGIALAYSRSWRLALVLSAMLPCIFMVGAFITWGSSHSSKQSLGLISKGAGLAQESLATLRTIHAFAAETKIARLYEETLFQARRHDTKTSIVMGFGMAMFSFIVYSTYSLSFFYGSILITQGHATAGDVVTVGLSILIGSFSLAIVGPNVEAVIHACEAAVHLYDAIDHAPSILSPDSSGRQSNKLVGDITFKGVDFRYPSRVAPVLSHLDLTFPAHKTSALVGLSGSGKSTILSLIERFYDVGSGTVTLDDIDIRELDLRWLRSQIGLVLQDPTLFSGTILENVSLGLIGTNFKDLSSEEMFSRVKEACTLAHIHDFIMSLPDGYQTLVGDHAVRLSGGQKQRIAIARAIVGDPQILLLDEPTSALDNQAEREVQSALKEAAKGRTTIIVAHRLSTIRDADFINVLGGGRLLERGQHYELMSNQEGPYAQLVHAQLLIHVEDVGGPVDGGHTGYEGRTEANSGQKMDLPVVQGRVKLRFSAWTMISSIYRHVPGMRMTYIVGAISGCLAGLVHPAFGIVYAKALRAFESSDAQTLRKSGSQAALWLFLIAICSTLALSIHNICFGKAASVMAASLRSETFKSLLSKRIKYFDQDGNSSAELTSKLVGEPEKIKGFAALTLGAILQCTVTCVGGAIVGLIFGWKLGLVGIACMPPIVAMGFIRLQLVATKERRARLAYRESARIASEAVDAIRTVASLGCEEHSCALYQRALQSSSKGSWLTTFFGNIAFALSLCAILFSVPLVFWYGSRLVASGEYSTFQFYVSFMSTVFGSWNAANVFMSVPDVASAAGAAQEILNIIHSEKAGKGSSQPMDEDLTSEKPVTNAIKFSGVCFWYPTRPETLVLDRMSFDIGPGAYVAFVGPSGSGKSTIIQLIERFYEPLAGDIMLGNRSVSRMNLEETRRQVSLVEQNAKLYNGSIRFNISLGASGRDASEVTEKELQNVCRMANILDFIETLPNGFDTVVGEGGSQLSGGQKQRIAIARALVKDPKILLLDEATSALDATSESVVQAALNNAAEGRTTVVIAHRLSTIQHADCIYFVEKGRIVESGTHSQLLARRGAYYRFAQLDGSHN